MATIVARAPPLPGRTQTPPPHLTLNTSSRGQPAAVPNKHIPTCSPGPRPELTPPASPPNKTAVIESSTLTYPPDRYPRISDDPPLYALTAHELAAAINHYASQPLPEPKQVFPWLHGLHADNQIQLAFFVARKRSLRKVPKCIRGLTVVKAGGDLTKSKIKGAIAPEELLVGNVSDKEVAAFLECDPRDGFSVRNFQIQACKLATVSDIIVYGDESTNEEEVTALAARIARAQKAWQDKYEAAGDETQLFNTFVVTDAFNTIQTNHREIVATDSNGAMTGSVTDFFYWERLEMAKMSRASEITHNVWLGPTPDPTLVDISVDPAFTPIEDSPPFDIMVEASDLAQTPDCRALKAMEEILESDEATIPQLEFPSSGSIMPPTWSQSEVDGLMETCAWMYRMAHGLDCQDGMDEKDHDGDSVMNYSPPQPRRILIHCTDGYTESSLLALAYFMYAEGLTVHDAWLRLHKQKSRNFFAYPSDVALLTSIQPRILQESPKWQGDSLNVAEPKWLSKMDGSLPSRILPYMYLGNLGHANNPELLKELGITRVLSVGEPVTWDKSWKDSWPKENLLYIDKVQDNGVDALTEEFQRCLDFIEKGKLQGEATLVHCRVGVSRSATICIAEVMNELGLSFPRAYCFVRARRLNVIIQPHLRFSYELLKYEEYQRVKRGLPLRRELEWPTIAREIALMNKPYSRQ